MPGDRSVPARAEERLGESTLSPATPRRTCAACRGKADKGELFRFAVVGLGGELLVELDEEQRLPGRGVYCHRTAACLGHAKLLPELAAALKRGSRSAERRIAWSGRTIEGMLQAAATRLAAAGSVARSEKQSRAAAAVDAALRELQQKSVNRGKKVRFPL